MDLRSWKGRVTFAIAELEKLDLGYPLSGNLLHAPAGETGLKQLSEESLVSESSPLLAMYRQLDGLSLPDVHNGYFIHSVELVLRGLDGGEPRRITGELARPILVFGTDGGGGRFAIGADGDGEILHLGEGQVEDSVFDGADGRSRLISSSLGIFLEQLLEDTEAFIRGDEDWQFLV